MQSEIRDTAISLKFLVSVTPESAFHMFTEDFARWYPSEYSWSQEVLESIGIEPGEGGHCYETGPFGFRLDWGRVLVWDPPHRLVFTWQIGADRQPVPDPAMAGEVDIRFLPEGQAQARVQFEHRGFDRYHGDSAIYQSMMASDQGWPYILGRFREACGQA